MLFIICFVFIFGGFGGGIVYNMVEFENIVKGGFDVFVMS